MIEWELEYTVPPPFRNMKPIFGIISKNGKVVTRRGYSVWRREARTWGEGFRLFTWAAMENGGVKGGDGSYKITLQLLVPDKRKRDPHNFLEFICDYLQVVLSCDDARFTTVTLANEVVDKRKIGIKLKITKLV